MSVLFADLVDFTSLSEHRDPEAVRDLLTRYFDRCRALIERHGGTVEKFIGDAVMAVWGTPVAREDDAERAVRAALSLTEAVTTLGQEVSLPELRLRVGVLTGQAAVDLGAEGQGMVLGDTVNTASRLQSLSQPGSVLVDDVTRRASEAAIAYEDAGTHHVKGREEPVHAFTALRIVAGAGGARRGAGLETPLVGRATELQAIIDTAERSAHEHRAALVAIVGDAGSGKSRLLWEYFKYLDGIEDARWWHQGRCLSYGEGVAYWALAEMVRTRAGINEEEGAAGAREKLRRMVEAYVTDERERRLVEPRLAHLLRLEERMNADRVDLFSGWRLFFERMAEAGPVILAFEDLQWADSGLLEFIDYLLEWSADHAIFVLALGRPEILERRPRWTPLILDRLDTSAIESILEALVPGLSEDTAREISQRAEGIPLYAVETIRMLLDRKLLVQDGLRYEVTGDISTLEVPETLYALVASRLDMLGLDHRTLLQDASVMGQSFSAASVAALGDRSEASTVALLDDLIAKQVLRRDDDPRSPDRGQYTFLQTLVRTVAYGTLARRTLKQRHLAAATYLQRHWPDATVEIAEVLASHYLEAIRAEPDADDVAELRLRAKETLIAAGRTAASLALGPEADRYFAQALELAEDDTQRAALFEHAGIALWRSRELDPAEARLRRAVELRQERGLSGGAAAISLAEMLRLDGRLDESAELLEPFRATTDDPDVDAILRGTALSHLAMSQVFSGRTAEGTALLELVLTELEGRDDVWPALITALLNRGVMLAHTLRLHESEAVLDYVVRHTEDHDLSQLGLRARYNLAVVLSRQYRYEEALRAAEAGLELGHERGDRSWDEKIRGVLPELLGPLGRWREAVRAAEQLLDDGDEITALEAASSLVLIAGGRGDAQLLERCRACAEAFTRLARSDFSAIQRAVLARAALERGDHASALGFAWDSLDDPGSRLELPALAYWVAIWAAINLNQPVELERLERWAAELLAVRSDALIRAGRARIVAELEHLTGDRAAARAAEDEAIQILTRIGHRPFLGDVLLDRWRRSADAAALEQSREIYTELGAARWLERLPRATAQRAQPSTEA